MKIKISPLWVEISPSLPDSQYNKNWGGEVQKPKKPNMMIDIFRQNQIFIWRIHYNKKLCGGKDEHTNLSKLKMSSNIKIDPLGLPNL